MGDWWNDPGALSRQYAPAVYRLAYARTGNRAGAEDVMQEVFLRLVKARPSFGSGAHAKAWLLRVAANCASDLFRLPWRRREEPLKDSLPAPDVLALDIIENLQSALDGFQELMQQLNTPPE